MFYSPLRTYEVTTLLHCEVILQNVKNVQLFELFHIILYYIIAKLIYIRSYIVIYICFIKNMLVEKIQIS